MMTDVGASQDTRAHARNMLFRALVRKLKQVRILSLERAPIAINAGTTAYTGTHTATDMDTTKVHTKLQLQVQLRKQSQLHILTPHQSGVRKGNVR